MSETADGVGSNTDATEGTATKDTSSANPEPQPVKRKRGRPRKYPRPDDPPTSSDAQATPNVQEGVTNGAVNGGKGTGRGRGGPRGRPRGSRGRGRGGRGGATKAIEKGYIQTQLSFGNQSDKPDGEVSAGANEKNDNDSGNSENAGEKASTNASPKPPDTPKRRRGRPPKTKPQDEGNNDDTEKVQGEEQLVCDSPLTPGVRCSSRKRKPITPAPEEITTPTRRTPRRAATKKRREDDEEEAEEADIPSSPPQKKRRRKRRDDDEDATFQPDEEEEEDEEDDDIAEEEEEIKQEEEEEEEEYEDKPKRRGAPKGKRGAKRARDGTPKTKNYKYVPKGRQWSKYRISPEEHKARYRERRKAAVAEPQEDVAFPRWLPRLPLPLESDYSAYVAGLPQESVSIITKKGQETPRRVPLFAGTPIAEDEEDLRPGDATLLLNAGGPVWGMDWCPLPHRPETWNALGTPTRQYLAVGCHPSPSSTHVQGKAVQGPALIQIWDLGPLSDDKEPYSNEEPPTMVLGILHEGGCVWDLKWCPSQGDTQLPPAEEITTLNEGYYPRLGLLAAALGDGSVAVLAIPHPAALRIRQGRTEITDAKPTPLFVHANALQVLRLRLPFCNLNRVQWSPQPPHNLLLTGCDDGSAAVWGLNPEVLGTSASPAEPVFVCNAHKRSSTSVAWHPTYPSVFCVSGQSSMLRLWDMRNPFVPLMSHGTSAGWVMDMVWGGEDYPYLVYSSDDHSIRTFCPSTLNCKIFRYHTVVPWSLGLSRWVGHLASASADGTVAVVTVDTKIMTASKSEYRPKEEVIQCNSISKVGDTEVLSWAMPEIPAPATKAATPKKSPAKGKATPKKGETQQQAPARTFPPDKVAFHRLVWSPNPSAAGWLATGGATGFVRLSHLSGLL